MGFALAEEAARRGAEVTLVTGPSQLKTSHPSVTRVDVESARQMKEACEKYFPSADAAVMSAAVADYTPETVADNKMKRTGDDLVIKLKPTTDIAAMLGKSKRDDQVLVGFALETSEGRKNAAEKLKRKNLDFIVLNSLEDEGAGFMGDTNKITIINKENKTEEFPLKSKQEVASDIIDHLTSYLK
jgi:phosphopantothenoylcysteine decarboxylase/phosphopantothenate--cysteine ligase